MKQETKTIIIGVVVTILVLAIAIFVIYKATEKNEANTRDTSKTTSNYNEQKTNNTTDDNNINNNTSSSANIKNENNVSTNDNVTEGKVTLYMFWGDGCPHCEHAKEFYDTIKDDYDYLDIKTYELWKSTNKKENLKLMEKVGEALDFDASGIPFIVIGDYKTSGFGNTKGEQIKKAIEDAHKNKNYIDIVQKVIDENPDIKADVEIYK